MLVGRHPIGQFVSDRFEVTSTAQLFGTEAFGHPARQLRDVTELCSFDKDALDAQGFEFPGRFRASRRVRRWSCHAERLSAPRSVVAAGRWAGSGWRSPIGRRRYIPRVGRSQTAKPEARLERGGPTYPLASASLVATQMVTRQPQSQSQSQASAVFKTGRPW
jgi:hypothetical protein